MYLCMESPNKRGEQMIYFDYQWNHSVLVLKGFVCVSFTLSCNNNYWNFCNGYLLSILTFHYLFCTLPCWTIAYMHLNDWMFIQSCHQVCLLCKMLMDQQSHSRCVFTRRCLLFTKNEIFIYKCIYNQQRNIFSFMHVLVVMEYDIRIRTISFISSCIIKNSYNKLK